MPPLPCSRGQKSGRLPRCLFRRPTESMARVASVRLIRRGEYARKQPSHSRQESRNETTASGEIDWENIIKCANLDFVRYFGPLVHDWNLQTIAAVHRVRVNASP